jgi:Arc/MetJ-type ribon-helix-helix transcriptional regulator
MKRKTSITLAPELVRALDALAGKTGNRSAVIERAVRELLAREAKRERDARELTIIDRNAERLNLEAGEVLGFQVES